MILLGVPMVIWNFKSYSRREYKIYAITKREYEPNFKRMDLQFKVKSIYYGTLFAVSLVMLILTLIDFVATFV